MTFLPSTWFNMMVPSETPLHSFIIRIWLKDENKANTPLQWRGHITHIPSNQRRHFEDLDDIKRFIELHLHIPQVGLE